MGGAVIVPPRQIEQVTEDKLNLLVVAKVSDAGVATYWAGSCWDKAGQFADAAAWKAYVERVAQGLLSPVEVRLTVQ